MSIIKKSAAFAANDARGLRFACNCILMGCPRPTSGRETPRYFIQRLPRREAIVLLLPGKCSTRRRLISLFLSSSPFCFLSPTSHRITSRDTRTRFLNYARTELRNARENHSARYNEMQQHGPGESRREKERFFIAAASSSWSSQRGERVINLQCPLPLPRSEESRALCGELENRE